MSKLRPMKSSRAGRARAPAATPPLAGMATPVLAAILIAVSMQVPAQDRPVPDTFEATTTGMTPEGLTLKLDVLTWSDAEARADVVAALESEGDVPAALAELPSAGVVWRSGSAVGHSIKYAHRDTDAEGRTRITVVTDKALDAYSFRPWEVPGRDAAQSAGYSVIELIIDGDGEGGGTLSLAADVAIDAEDALVTLADGGIEVLTAAHELPKPYWARSGG